MTAEPDPVLVRRAMIARLAVLGQRVGYVLYAAAVVLFVVGFIIGFTPAVVTTIVTAMIVGSALLAPAIVAGYAVKAAARTASGAGRLPSSPSRDGGVVSPTLGSEDRATTARLPASQRRRQLLTVAVEAFGTNGFHKTSMSALAAAAGVTKPVLYQHFRSKSELYLEVLRDIGGRLRDDLGKAVADAPSAHSQVEAGFRAYFQFFANEPFAFEVLFGDGSRRDDEFAREAHAVEESIAENIAQLIAIDDLPELDRQVLAFGIVGLAEGASRYWMSHHVDLAPSDLASRVADLAWYGLRGRPGGKQGPSGRLQSGK